jgi:hypothetical protein
MFTISGLDEIRDNIIKLKSNMVPLVEQSFNDISQRFTEDVKNTQMSGRPGVNEISGTLKKSLLYETKVSTTVQEFNIYSDCVYISVHQHGYSERSIPKRLNIVELMINKYEKEYTDVLENIVNKTL